MIELLDSDSGRRVAIACNACSMKITGAATAVLVPWASGYRARLPQKRLPVGAADPVPEHRIRADRRVGERARAAGGVAHPGARGMIDADTLADALVEPRKILEPNRAAPADQLRRQ